MLQGGCGGRRLLEKVTQNSSLFVKFAALIPGCSFKKNQKSCRKEEPSGGITRLRLFVFCNWMAGCGKSGLNSSRFVWICLVFEASTLQNVDSKQQTAVA